MQDGNDIHWSPGKGTVEKGPLSCDQVMPRGITHNTHTHTPHTHTRTHTAVSSRRSWTWLTRYQHSLLLCPPTRRGAARRCLPDNRVLRSAAVRRPERQRLRIHAVHQRDRQVDVSPVMLQHHPRGVTCRAKRPEVGEGIAPLDAGRRCGVVALKLDDTKISTAGAGSAAAVMQALSYAKATRRAAIL